MRPAQEGQAIQEVMDAELASGPTREIFDVGKVLGFYESPPPFSITSRHAEEARLLKRRCDQLEEQWEVFGEDAECFKRKIPELERSMGQL